MEQIAYSPRVKGSARESGSSEGWLTHGQAAMKDICTAGGGGGGWGGTGGSCVCVCALACVFGCVSMYLYVRGEEGGKTGHNLAKQVPLLSSGFRTQADPSFPIPDNCLSLCAPCWHFNLRPSQPIAFSPRPGAAHALPRSTVGKHRPPSASLSVVGPSVRMGLLSEGTPLPWECTLQPVISPWLVLPLSC